MNLKLRPIETLLHEWNRFMKIQEELLKTRRETLLEIRRLPEAVRSTRESFVPVAYIVIEGMRCTPFLGEKEVDDKKCYLHSSGIVLPREGCEPYELSIDIPFDMKKARLRSVNCTMTEIRVGNMCLTGPNYVFESTYDFGEVLAIGHRVVARVLPHYARISSR